MSVPVAEHAAAKAVCEHYWAAHVYGGLSVRLCQLCHEPDWDDVRAERWEAERVGALGERESIRQLAIEHAAVYFTGNMTDGLDRHNFADLLGGES